MTPTIVQGLQSKVTAAQLFKGPPPGSRVPLLRDGPEPGSQVLASSVLSSETLSWNEVDVDEKVRWNELAQDDAVWEKDGTLRPYTAGEVAFLRVQQHLPPGTYALKLQHNPTRFQSTAPEFAPRVHWKRDVLHRSRCTLATLKINPI